MIAFTNKKRILLNYEISNKIMGVCAYYPYRSSEFREGVESVFCRKCEEPKERHFTGMQYTTDITAALTIVYGFKPPWIFDLRWKDGRWKASFFKTKISYEAKADTPALAICLAALKTL